MSRVAQLPAHLESTYGIRVTKMTPLEPWGPEGAQRVDIEGGPSWVARPHGPERPIDAVHGDAEILRFLEEHSYPSERLAHREPVSPFGDGSVIVTKLLPGVNCRGDNSPATVNGVGRLLGLLHSLPQAPGAVSRPAGGWHHLSQAGGGRDEDVRILLPLLEKLKIPPAQEDALAQVFDELRSLDMCEDLPHALINVDFGGPNIIKHGDILKVVDWTGSGRGPRIHSVVCLMAGAWDLALVDAFVAGYREHATLEPEEIERLPEVLPIFSFVLDCWGIAFRGAMPSDVLKRLAGERDAARRVAERARDAFAKME